MSLLDVNNLSVYFHTRDGVVKAVEDVSFSVDQGETLAIVGESGSGKSVACYSLLGLIPMPPGKIESGTALFEGRDLLSASMDELRAIRGDDICMVFQDPMTCLNPYMTIGKQLVEPLIYKRGYSKADAKERVIELLHEVGIRNPESNFDAWPHEFSGGMRQRAMIAMALISEPKLLIADEPTTALDVTIQKQILELVVNLQKRRNIGVIFISHDLAVVRSLADNVVVMESGKIVEHGKTTDIFDHPTHAYTRKLLAAIPKGAKTVPGRAEEELLLDVSELTTTFHDRSTHQPFKAVDSVSFTMKKGEILGLVGESGSGKSTLGRSILNLVQPASGSVLYRGQQLVGMSPKQMRPLRKHMQMIFQDPYSSLNPRMTIFDTLAEPLKLQGVKSRSEIIDTVFEIMDDVGLKRSYVRKYPHEFSGGQRQRIAIGRAIATRPEFIVADEPVSALDVTIQKQILDLLLVLVEKHDLSMLFISHDLAVVRAICDRVLVMNSGKILEEGETEALWASPRDAYTKTLLSALHL
jgi:ABC-type microcin C transport system duplicated ATPase subunit YejF